MGAQLVLFDDKVPREHGGQHSVGRRKGQRPLDSKRPIHLVLRSSHAKGPLSLILYSKWIRELLGRLTRRWGIVLYEFSCNSNHLHLLIRAKSREGFGHFLRAFAGAVAMKVTGACKGKPFGKRFWDTLAFSRLAEWGKSFRALKKYVIRNSLEALGVIPYQPRQRKSICKKE